jgi:hypothetical protein
MVTSAVPVFAQQSPPTSGTWLDVIVDLIRLALHGQWGELFSSLGGIVLVIGGMAAIVSILGWMLKPIEKLVEKEGEKEKQRRLRLGIVTPPGGKSTFPVNAVLLVRGIKSALNPNSDASEPAPATNVAPVKPVPPFTPDPAAIKPSPRASAPTPSPVAAAAPTSSGQKIAEPAVKTVTPAPVTPAETPAPVAKQPTPAAKQPAPASEESRTPPAPADSPAKKSVFISYRRQDSPHITGRIYDRLAARFGREFVFKDVDSIPLGLDFRNHLQEQVGRCAVLVAVIGKNWNPLSSSGEARLSDTRDYLRIEIESALERQVPVIPVLVDGIEMPREAELPRSLANLAYHNGISVRQDPDFHHDMDRLVRGIERLLK